MISFNMNRRSRIVALCGSNRQGSYTRLALSIALREAAATGASVQLIDLGQLNLVFAGSVSQSEYPEDVLRLRQTLLEADGIILGSPEYHGSLSGMLKNALDLMSKNEFEHKLVGLIGVAGGHTEPMNVLNHMRAILRNLHAWVLPEQVAIGSSYRVFDQQGRILDEQIHQRLRSLGQQIAQFAPLQNQFRAWSDMDQALQAV